MRNSLTGVLGAGSAAILALTSCAADDAGAGSESADVPELAETVDIEVLQENQTQYLGETSSVIALVDATGAGLLGERTVELDTDSEPYALTVRFSSGDFDFSVETVDELMRDRSVLLLATIGNVDEIRWSVDLATGEDTQGSLTRDEADELLDVPVAEQASTLAELEELVAELEAS